VDRRRVPRPPRRPRPRPSPHPAALAEPQRRVRTLPRHRPPGVLATRLPPSPVQLHPSTAGRSRRLAAALPPPTPQPQRLHARPHTRRDPRQPPPPPSIMTTNHSDHHLPPRPPAGKDYPRSAQTCLPPTWMSWPQADASIATIHRPRPPRRPSSGGRRRGGLVEPSATASRTPAARRMICSSWVAAPGACMTALLMSSDTTSSASARNLPNPTSRGWFEPLDEPRPTTDG
jgi:hypothetical protein